MTRVLVVLATFVSATFAFQDITVVDWLKQNGFHKMTELLQSSNMDADLSANGAFTVFAPTDAAFNRLGTQIVNIQGHPAELKRMLQYHVVREFVLVPVINGFKTMRTLLTGEDITLHKISNTEALLNNGTRIIPTQDNLCRNGVVQPIDGVLFPPIVQSLNIAQIIMQDEAKMRDFAVALLITGLLPLLETGEFTVFVPNNAAFAPFADGMLDPDRPRATIVQSEELMKYYIIPGARTLDTLKHAHQLYTIHGTMVNVTVSGTGVVMINHAQIIESDILASNGVIHIVDRVIAAQDVIDEMYRNHTEYLPPPGDL